MLAQQPIQEKGEQLLSIWWLPELPSAWDSPASSRSCELWPCGWEDRVSHPWWSWCRVTSKRTGLFAPMLNKHPVVVLSYSLPRDFSRFLFSCSPILEATLQIGSSFASPLCSLSLRLQPLQSSQRDRPCSVYLLVSFFISNEHLPTLSRFGGLNLLHSCQGKTRVITWMLSHMHTLLFSPDAWNFY